MRNKALFSLAFIIGTVTGSVVTWYLLKDKYEALAQEEIDSVKEVFLRREQELKDQSVKKTVAEGIKDADKEKPDLKEYARRLEKEGYTRYSDFGSDEEEKLIRIFYYGNKPGLVYIITIVAANHGEVHHAVGDAFPFGCYIFFHN